MDIQADKSRRWTAVALGVLVVVGAAAARSAGRKNAAPACDRNGDRRAENPILAIHHVPSLTADRYDAVVRGLTNGRGRLESLSDGGIEGLLFHASGQGPDGFWVVDVWASQEAIDRFGERVGPIAKAAGITEPMKAYSVHSLLLC